MDKDHYAMQRQDDGYYRIVDKRHVNNRPIALIHDLEIAERIVAALNGLSRVPEEHE